MNWKEFLKPDLEKIIIHLILFIFLFLSFLSSLCMQLSVRCDPIFYTLVFPLGYVGVIVSLTLLPFFIIMDFLNIPFPELVSLIVLAIESYILSCLIIWIYDKARKK